MYWIGRCVFFLWYVSCRVGGQRWYLCLGRGGVMAGGVSAAAHQPVQLISQFIRLMNGTWWGVAWPSRKAQHWTFTLSLDSGWGGSPAPPVDSFVSLFLCLLVCFVLVRVVFKFINKFFLLKIAKLSCLSTFCPVPGTWNVTKWGLV